MRFASGSSGRKSRLRRGGGGGSTDGHLAEDVNRGRRDGYVFRGQLSLVSDELSKKNCAVQTYVIT